jgi:hypothetical protein
VSIESQTTLSLNHLISFKLSTSLEEMLRTEESPAQKAGFPFIFKSILGFANILTYFSMVSLQLLTSSMSKPMI